jgi:hypothetical protein
MESSPVSAYPKDNTYRSEGPKTVKTCRQIFFPQ